MFSLSNPQKVSASKSNPLHGVKHLPRGHSLSISVSVSLLCSQSLNLLDQVCVTRSVSWQLSLIAKLMSTTYGNGWCGVPSGLQTECMLGLLPT